MPDVRPLLAAALLLPLAGAGCFGPGYEAGWRIVDRDKNCSECEGVVYRTDGSDALEASWSGHVEASHDLWITYADPYPDPARIVVNVTWTPAREPIGLVFGGRAFWCAPEGGNTTADGASYSGLDTARKASWRMELRPGRGTCEADLEWGKGWSATIVEWFVPDDPESYSSAGAAVPIDVTFTARRL